MGHHEKEWLENYGVQGPIFYRRYVDDIFLVFEKVDQATEFYNYYNSKHNNIKFTKDDDLKPGVLSFLDILVKNEGEVVTSVYQKGTYTGLLTNFRSFIPYVYKLMLINTLVDRIFKINNTWKGFDLDIKRMTSTLCRNMFPLKLIERVVGKYLLRKLDKQFVREQNSKIEPRYFKLPYIGEVSKILRHNLNRTIKKYCTNVVDLKLVFTGSKIKNYFSQKDAIPECFKSFVVYKFTCARCNSRYVGHTHRHHTTRLNEHLGNDKESNVYQHLEKQRLCKRVNDENSFTVLDTAHTQYKLGIKEALYIKWLKPNLNKQKVHTKITLIL